MTGFRPPLPHQGFDGDIASGTSYKLGSSQMPVVDKEGRPGIIQSDVYEHAFLQLQLQESIEINRRKDEQVANQQSEIKMLYEKIRRYLLTQDQLYKDYVRLERGAKKTQEQLKDQNRASQDLVMEE